MDEEIIRSNLNKLKQSHQERGIRYRQVEILYWYCEDKANQANRLEKDQRERIGKLITDVFQPEGFSPESVYTQKGAIETALGIPNLQQVPDEICRVIHSLIKDLPSIRKSIEYVEKEAVQEEIIAPDFSKLTWPPENLGDMLEVEEVSETDNEPESQDEETSGVEENDGEPDQGKNSLSEDWRDAEGVSTPQPQPSGGRLLSSNMAMVIGGIVLLAIIVFLLFSLVVPAIAQLFNPNRAPITTPLTMIAQESVTPVTDTPIPTQDPATIVALAETIAFQTAVIQDMTRNAEATAAVETQAAILAEDILDTRDALTAAAIPTSTPSFTPTLTPTPIPTETNTPTITPTPTPQPLSVGEAYEDERISMRLNDTWINSGITYRSVSFPVGFKAQFVFKNKLNESFLLNVPYTTIKLVDNNGREYSHTKRGSYDLGTLEVNQTIGGNGTYPFFVVWGGEGAIKGDVDYLIITMEDFSSLGDLRWIVEVQN